MTTEIKQHAATLLTAIDQSTEPGGPLEHDTWAILLGQTLSAFLDEPGSRQELVEWKQSGGICPPSSIYWDYVRNPTPAIIIAARKKTGQTQTQAAQSIDIQLRSWQRYEGGERKMSLQHFERYCVNNDV